MSLIRHEPLFETADGQGLWARVPDPAELPADARWVPANGFWLHTPEGAGAWRVQVPWDAFESWAALLAARFGAVPGGGEAERAWAHIGALVERGVLDASLTAEENVGRVAGLVWEAGYEPRLDRPVKGSWNGWFQQPGPATDRRVENLGSASTPGYYSGTYDHHRLHLIVDGPGHGARRSIAFLHDHEIDDGDWGANMHDVGWVRTPYSSLPALATHLGAGDGDAEERLVAGFRARAGRDEFADVTGEPGPVGKALTLFEAAGVIAQRRSESFTGASCHPWW
ncbi:hypothetical protein [Actinoplanes sp. RD1]|uniref:hypothetical protein n=1 Tax=Actinoplanes sp. RD1 TaxID=3064538 RepID=UPI002740BB32|nr:hypothetical protein [Actinoplanes sp. RD1]